MDVQVQGTAEALDQSHGTGLRSGLRQPRFPDQVCGNRSVDDTEYGGESRRLGGKQKAQWERHTQHPLAQRLPRQDIIHQQCRRLHHASRTAARAEAPALAAECHQPFRMALGAAHAQEAMLQPAALQVGRELLLYVDGQRAAILLQSQQEQRVVLVDQIIKKSRFGAVALVVRARADGQWPGCLLQQLHRRRLRMPGGL